jgi:hypothetical protein
MSCDIQLLLHSHTDTVDIQQFGDITNAEGLLSTGPKRGDLITFDWEDGAEWQPGPLGPYSFEVPIVMKGATLGERLYNLLTYSQMLGAVLHLERIQFAGAAGEVHHHCLAVVSSAIRVNWDLRRRTFLSIVVVFQVLRPWGDSVPVIP